MKYLSDQRKSFGIFAISGSTLASMVLSAAFYLVLPLSLPLTSAHGSTHCHCAMCQTDVEGEHHCCQSEDGICNCNGSTPADDAVIVLIRDIPSLPIYGRFEVPFGSGYWNPAHLSPYSGIVLSVEIPPPEA